MDMGTDTIADIDELDRKILNELLKNGRKSFRKIAEAVDSTPATVINRVERLEEAGVVTGYSADINYHALGFEAIAVVEVIVKGQHAKEVEQEVADHNNVVSVYSITGDTDILLMVKFKEKDDLTAFIRDELLASDKVEKTITHLAFATFKEDHQPRL